MIILGLMSGTSLDGLDMAVCEIQGNYTETECRLLASGFSEMPSRLRQRIQQAIDEKQSSNRLLCSLDFEIGTWYTQAIQEFCQQQRIDLKTIDYISSHGQTIYHLPEPGEGECASTLQLGQPAVMAYHLGIPVVSNFRVMDMAAQGQGAPLVPYVDYVLFSSLEKSIALQNLGGIGNVTYLKKAGSLDEVIAFDTGPANMMIDEAMNVLFGCDYDNQGETAAKGKVIAPLLDELMAHPYFDVNPPKSTGREMFGVETTRYYLEKYKAYAPEDLVCTFTEFTAYSMERSYRDFLMMQGPLDEVILGGGGSHNRTLLAMLQKRLPEVVITTQQAKGYDTDAKEAIAFAILANETLHAHFANVPSATGAERKVVLGMITPKPY